MSEKIFVYENMYDDDMLRKGITPNQYERALDKVFNNLESEFSELVDRAVGREIQHPDSYLAVISGNPVDGFIVHGPYLQKSEYELKPNEMFIDIYDVNVRSQTANYMWMAVCGNMASGYTIFGIFDNEQAVKTWAKAEGIENVLVITMRRANKKQ